MKKVFPSKVDIVLPLLFIITSIPGIVTGIRNEDRLVLPIIIIVFILILYLLFDTKYIITKGNLKVHSGFIVNKNILIENIYLIKQTDSILSAPASSISERIEVFYEDSKSIIISPKDRRTFIDELRKQNPAIKIDCN
jgi:hypothetical protein